MKRPHCKPLQLQRVLKMHEIRKIALEISAADDLDVVKVASILSRIKNWWRALGDPEYKARVEELKETSAKFKSLLDEVQRSVDKLQKTISDTDVENYDSSLEQMRSALLALNAEIDDVERSVSNVEDAAQPAAKRDNVRWNYTQEELGDKKVIDELKSQFPEGHDVAVSNKIEKPLKSFNWFKKFGPENIIISDRVENIINKQVAGAIAKKLAMYGDWKQDYYMYLLKMKDPNVETEFQDKLKDAILNGTLVEYNFAKPSKEVKQRQANEVHMRVLTKPFSFSIKRDDGATLNVNVFAKCLLNDMAAAYVGRDNLDMMGFTNVQVDPNLVGIVDPEQQHEPESDLPPEEFMDYEQQEYPDGDDGFADDLLSSAGPMERMVSQALARKAFKPVDFTITLRGESFHVQNRFARILTSALRAELGAESSVRSDGNKIEVECTVYGPEKTSTSAVKSLTDGISELFVEQKGFNVKASVYENVISKYAIIKNKMSEEAFRKFAIHNMRKR